MAETRKYKWAAVGDVNAFFGLMLDNVMNLVILAGILIYVFGFPQDVVYTKMFPGTALGVMFGDLVYTWLAFRLAKKTGRSDVTAMPLGLDAPSTIGMAFAVLGPAFMAAKATMPDAEAAIMAWKVGMATMVLIGLFKLVMSFFGDQIHRIVPQAGLLGSLAGIGIALLGCLQLAEIFAEPVVGMVSLGLLLYTLVARNRLPGGFPAVLASVGVGAILFYGLGAMGLSRLPVSVPEMAFPLAFPIPNLGFLDGMSIAATTYIPVAVPFAILTVIGGINVTESARLAGDDYDTRTILLTEAFATLLAGVCGGVSQSTPYIGHPAYKAMGGRAAYTLATGLFVGLGGMLGYIPFMAKILPIACLAPILIFVAIDIVEQSFHATPKAHAAAVVLAMFPSVAQLVLIVLDKASGGQLLSAAITPEHVAEVTHIPPPFVENFGVFIVLAHGFILTGMLWGGALAYLIDRKFVHATVVLFVCSALSLFGIIHSIQGSGGIYLPWTTGSTLPYHWAAAYAAFGAMVLGLGLVSAPATKAQPSGAA
jgi:AGZA family xanthine/uracil permease-like MFS transporter